MTPVYRPLAYLLFSFSIGIGAGRQVEVESWILFVAAGLLFMLLVWRTLRTGTSLLLPVFLLVVMGAIAAKGIPNPDRPPPEIKNLLQHKKVLLMGSISTPPEHRPDQTKMLLHLQAFERNHGMEPVSGKLLLTIRGCCPTEWLVGQQVVGRVFLRPVRNFNNPGGFNYRQHLANQGIWLNGYVRHAADLIPIGKPICPPWQRLLNHIRLRSRTFLKSWLPSELAGFYQALLLGERSALPMEIRERLYAAGIGHLLAISGLHLGMVAGLAFLVFKFFLVRTPPLVRRWSAQPLALLAAFPIALGYAGLTGMGVPALRATIMLAVFTVGLLIQRGNDLLNSLLVAALVILIVSPGALFTASFQLSFVAVAVLLWFMPRLPVPAWLKEHARQEQRLRRGGLRLYQFAAASLIVSLATAPLSLYHFHRLTVAGIGANLLAVPLVGFLALPAGLLSLFLLPFSSALAGFALTLGCLGLNVVLKLATMLERLPWATLWLGPPTAWQTALILAALFLLPFAKLSRWWRCGLLVSASLVLAVSWWPPSWLLPERPCLRVTYLDVGQGNAAVVEFPGRAAMLIDGGGYHASTFDMGRHVVAPYLWHRGIRHLEAMVLSHAHPDHFRGLHFVADHFSVKEFWYNTVPADDPDFMQMMSSLNRRKIPCLGPRELASPRRIQGVDIHLLHPPPDLPTSWRIHTYSAVNNLSLVLRLTYKKVSFLFPGDIEAEAEHRLTTHPDLGQVQVLLVPHHGSRTSSSPGLLEKLKPQIAVYSIGFNNLFHLPAAQVRQRYRALGVRTYRTDRHGAITVMTDGEKMEVKTFLNEITLSERSCAGQSEPGCSQGDP
jgi:competence protein ComEC